MKSSTSRSLPGLFLLGLLAFSCDDGAEAQDAKATNDLAQDTVAPDDSQEIGESDAVVGELPPLTGTWAQKQVLASIAVLPIGGTANRTSTTYQIVTFSEQTDSGTFSSVVDVCTVMLDSGTEFTKTALPQTAADAIADSPRTGTLTPNADGTLAYQQETFVDIRGAHLNNPLSDPLPTLPDDPAVVDQDGDGNPGITVVLTGAISGEVYVVQRITATHTGRYLSADTIEGQVQFSDEQNILEATNEVLKSPTQSSPDPDKNASYFKTVRIESGADCQWLMQNLDKVFP